MREETNNAYRFIRAYNELDHFMDLKLNRDSRYNSYYQRIIELSKRDSTFRKHKLILHSFGELRNAIVHDFGRDNMEIIAEPHLKQVELFERILREVMDPPKALDTIAVRFKNLYTASMEAPVREVMTNMTREGFSYVPVMEEGRMIGVFSDETIFQYVRQEGFVDIRKEFRLKDLALYLTVEAHEKETFQFASRKESVADLEERLVNTSKGEKRLEVVFLTENGRPEEKLLGMVTVWDLAKGSFQESEEESSRK